MPEKTGLAPSLFQRATVNVEIAKMRAGVRLFQLVWNGKGGPPAQVVDGSDPFGVGSRYAPWVSSIWDSVSIEKRIATHRTPDADALVAAWLVQRYGFPGQSCHVEFVDRAADDATLSQYDCVVDVGRVHDEDRLRFDHKPPAFDDRDLNCATRLVWNALCRVRDDVDHLEPLIDLVHDGDAISRRRSSAAYQESRSTGLHAHIRCLRETAESDSIVYHSIALWLDAMWGAVT